MEKSNILSEEQRKKAIESIISILKEEKDIQIGIVLGNTILDEFIEHIGNQLYNQGVEDSRKLIKSKLDDLDIELEVLLKK